VPKDNWTTAVGEVGHGVVNVRGYSLSEIIERLTFADAVYLTIRGELPSQAQRRLLDAALCSILEHGLYAPTTLAARVVASAAPQSVIPGLAAGVLTIGSITVSPQHSAELIEQVDDAMAQGSSRAEAAERIAAQLVRTGKRMPGIGHPLHPDGDPRAESLQRVAEKVGLWTGKSKGFLAVREAYLRQTKRTLPVNIDGMLGCVLTELGFRPLEMPGIAAISFMPGVIAHCVEEITSPPTLRIAEAAYVGSAPRRIEFDEAEPWTEAAR
jgi:citrate synthase